MTIGRSAAAGGLLRRLSARSNNNPFPIRWNGSNHIEPVRLLDKADRMGNPKKRLAPRHSEWRGKAMALIGAALLSTHSLGCASHSSGMNEPVAAETKSLTLGTAPFAPASQTPPKGSQADGEEKKAAGEHEGTDAGQQPKRNITLPMAIQMCVTNNFRVLAGAERVRMAEADLVTSSLIPNPSLFADSQLIPLQHADINNQLGPPQDDALVSIPIDWLLFGKRVAAMQAARLGIDVSSAEAANVLRTQVAQTVDAFYEVLEDDAYFKLAEKHLAQLEEYETVTRELQKNNKVGILEVDRVTLAVHEALLERHDRELALEIAKTRLRPLIGRTAADPDYEVEGDLAVTAVIPPPKLEEVIAIAEAHRPDLISGRKAIEQAKATVELERRRGQPQVAIQPGYTYQDQAHYSAYRNGSLFDIGVSMSLPFTDRNQGNILRAKAQMQERQFTYEADRADVLADVEASRASYEDAVEHLTQFNKADTLKAAADLRKNMEVAYRTGDHRLIELLDAQRAYRDRLGHVIEFESFYWRSLNRLNAAVGLKVYDPGTKATEPVGKDADER
jgi:outer membrane protein, heavy metal efflux system